MINVDYYGSESTWIPYTTDPAAKYVTYTADPAGGLYGTVARGTLSDFHRIGRLELNSFLDASCCYAGMDPYADICSPHWINRQGETLGRIRAAGVTPFFLGTSRLYNSEAAASSIIVPATDSSSWGMDRTDETISGAGMINNDGSIAPIVRLSGRSVVLLICVLAAVPGSTEGSTTDAAFMTLDDYISDYESTGQRSRICGIYAIPYIVSDGVQRTRYSAPVYTSGLGKSLAAITLQTAAVSDQQLLHYSKTMLAYPDGRMLLSGRGGTAGSAADVAITVELDSSAIPIYGDIWHPMTASYGSGYFRIVWVYADIDADFGGIDSFKEYCYKQSAYLGLFFTGSASLAQSLDDDDLLDDGMYLGIIDSDGITRGYYTHGAENQNQQQYDIDYDPIRDSTFDPEAPYDPNRYDERSILNRGSGLTGFGMGAACYAVTTAEISGLMTYLYTIVPELLDPETQTDYSKYFLNQNPVDLIVSLTAFPFDLTPYIASRRTLTIGNQAVKSGLPPADVSVGVIGGAWGSDAASGVITLDAGSCTYFPTFGDYRDYEGSAELYIPYCGSVHIDPATYMGHQISVKYLVDLRTGACLALIYRDQLITDSIPGQMGVSIPFSGLQQADYQKALHNARQQLLQRQSSEITGLVGGLVSMGAGAATGNPLAVAGGAAAIARSAATADISDAEWQLQHVKAPIRSIGTASAATSMISEQAVRLVITRPKMLSYDPAAYAHSVGYACYRVGSLSQYSGYTQAVSVDLSGIAATDEELQMIRAALASGVYL